MHTSSLLSLIIAAMLTGCALPPPLPPTAQGPYRPVNPPIAPTRGHPPVANVDASGASGAAPMTSAPVKEDDHGSHR